MRSQIKIIVDILDTLEQSENGVKITGLVRKVNVPYVRLIELLDELLKKNFIELTEEAGNNYKITKKGEILLSEYRRFSIFAQNLGLDLD
ncbi:MAG: winged helix-turn-helix domain-containing protein [Conexivisphaerales archaeon]